MNGERRFEFGRNWQSFISRLTDDHIAEAERSLADMFQNQTLRGKSLLDVGSGSGLFGLAARRLGARVFSFDYDPTSVECTRELRRRYLPQDEGWTVDEGSVLDEQYVKSLGAFDIVYAWGVLHHTGNMWKAMANVQAAVAPRGTLLIALYNDQGIASEVWRTVKRVYCSGAVGRSLVSAVMVPYFAARAVGLGLVTRRGALAYFAEYRKRRGMSAYHDWVDWLGGYPFEVARPERVVAFYRDAGFVLKRMIQTRRHGCNQYVFEKV